MSKIGRLPINLPQGVQIVLEGNNTKVIGPKGTLTQELPRGINVEVKDGVVKLSSTKTTKQGMSLFGTMRALIANMVEGVEKGWSKKLELVGTGYRAETDGKTLTLAIGFSHPVKLEAPEGITYKVEKSFITIEGIDKQLVGQVAADVRSVRPPEPYKGKGIKYVDEIVRRKAGKAAKVGGAA